MRELCLIMGPDIDDGTSSTLIGILSRVPCAEKL